MKDVAIHGKLDVHTNFNETNTKCKYVKQFQEQLHSQAVLLLGNCILDQQQPYNVSHLHKQPRGFVLWMGLCTIHLLVDPSLCHSLAC